MAYSLSSCTILLMTLNDLEVIHLLQAFSTAIRRTFLQHLTRYQLTARRAVHLR